MQLDCWEVKEFFSAQLWTVLPTKLKYGKKADISQQLEDVVRSNSKLSIGKKCAPSLVNTSLSLQLREAELGGK